MTTMIIMVGGVTNVIFVIIRWAVYRTDHLIISLELPLFIHLFIIRWAVYRTNHLIILLNRLYYSLLLGGLYIIQTTL